MSETASTNWLRLYDPNRNPTDWTDLIRPGQVAVFLLDLDASIELTPAATPLEPGSPSGCYVFDNLAAARAWCETLVRDSHRLRCDVYDARGKASAPLQTFTHHRSRRRVLNRGTARLLALVGVLLIATSPLLFWIDYRHRGILIVPTLVGMNCIAIGCRLLWWANTSLEELEARESAARAHEDAGE